MTRLIALVVAGLLLCGVVFGIGYRSGQPSVKTDTTIWSTGPTVTHIESLGQLVATKVYVSDVLTAEGEGYRGSWLIKGDGLISIDLTRAHAQHREMVAQSQAQDGLISIDLTRAHVFQIDPKIRRAWIMLPQPKVLSARVDHERSKTWSVEKTSWLPWRGDGDALRDQAMFHAQKLVEHAASSKDNMDHARGSAEKVLESVYRMVEWQVVIEWEATQQG